MNVLIIGSCVSRDIFNLPAAQDFQIPLYVARSSLASIFAPIPFRDIYSEHVKSPFQKRLIEWDITKKSLGRIKSAVADVVIMDSIDERFNLATLPNGGRFTASPILMATKPKLPSTAKTVMSGTPLFMEWWTEGWIRLLEALDEKKLKDKIIINKVFCQHQTTTGVKFEIDMVNKLNETLSKIYEIQERSLKPSQFIEYENRLSCPDTHRWGPSPFHFDETSQIFALNKIKELVNNGV
ncbi:DUF6270 domain-containing protein [Alcaligenes nematophilus]